MTAEEQRKRAEQGNGASDFLIIGGKLIQYFGLSTNVIIPHGVNVIGEGAFKNCSGITSVRIPHGVLDIEASAFQGCRNLMEIVMPNSVKTMGPFAFCDCTNLTRVVLSRNLEGIELFSFYGCRNLKDLVIPEGVKRIGPVDHDSIIKNEFAAWPTVFWGCSSLTHLDIPEGITAIGEYSFYGCTGLKSVSLPKSLQRIEYGAFSDCVHLEEIKIPENVTYIGYGAFAGCSRLQCIEIPASVEEIGFGALPNVRKIVVESNKVIHISTFTGHDEFNNITLTHIHFSEGVERVDLTNFCRFKKLEEFTFADSVKTVCGSIDGGHNAQIKIVHASTKWKIKHIGIFPGAIPGEIKNWCRKLVGMIGSLKGKM